MFTRAKSGLMLVFLFLSVLELSYSGYSRAVGTTVYDDFESYATGTFPYSGGWELWFDGAGSQFQTIVDSVSVSPTKSLQLLGMGGWAAFAAKRFSSSSSEIGFEVCVRVEEVTNGTYDNARVSFTKLLSSSMSREYAPILFSDSGVITCGSMSLQPYAPRTWYKVKLTLDRSTDTCSIWIDGELRAQDLPMSTTSPPDTTKPSYEIEAFLVSQCYNGVKVFFDDVRLFGVEESVSRVPGVHPEDWAKYDIALNYTTNDSNPPVPPPPLEYENVDYYGIRVIAVVGTNITFETSVRFENGTETSYISWVDVSPDRSMMFPPPFIAANLSAGDVLYNTPYPVTINATAMRTYAGAEREVACLEMTQDVSYTPEYRITMELKIYWDRASGIVDELIQSQHITRIPEGYETQLFGHLIMRETNIWKPAPVAARLYIFPRTLNLRSEGRWVTAWVLLPAGYDAREIDASTIMLNDTVPQAKHMALGIRLLVVKFDRKQVASYILENVKTEEKLVTVALTVNGKFKDGTAFQGSDKIRVIIPRQAGMQNPYKLARSFSFGF